MIVFFVFTIIVSCFFANILTRLDILEAKAEAQEKRRMSLK